MKTIIRDMVTANPRIQPIYHLLRGMLPRSNSNYRIDSPESKIIIIVGCGRSGNTLVRRLLMERADIYIPPESYVLGGVVSTLIRNPNVCWEECVNLVVSAFEYQSEFFTFEIESLKEFAVHAKGWGSERRSVGKLIYELYGWIAAKKEVAATWMGDKTPNNTLELGLIHRLFPNGKYLYIERDPFDVVDSYIKAGIYSNYMDAADRWLISKKAWKSFRTMVPESQVLTMTYEDLVGNNEKSITTVMSAFGIPNRIGRFGGILDLGDVNHHSHHSEVVNQITSSSVGKGRTQIPTEVRADLAKRLNEEACRSGYLPL